MPGVTPVRDEVRRAIGGSESERILLDDKEERMSMVTRPGGRPGMQEYTPIAEAECGGDVSA